MPIPSNDFLYLHLLSKSIKESNLKIGCSGIESNASHFNPGIFRLAFGETDGVFNSNNYHKRAVSSPALRRAAFCARMNRSLRGTPARAGQNQRPWAGKDGLLYAERAPYSHGTRAYVCPLLEQCGPSFSPQAAPGAASNPF